MGLTDIKRYLHTVYGHKRYTVIQMVNESLMTLEFALLGGVFIPYLHHSQAGTVARPPSGQVGDFTPFMIFIYIFIACFEKIELILPKRIRKPHLWGHFRVLNHCSLSTEWMMCLFLEHSSYIRRSKICLWGYQCKV